MNWAEFKHIIEKKGVKDTDEIAYIEIFNGNSEDTISVEQTYSLNSDAPTGVSISDR